MWKPGWKPGWISGLSTLPDGSNQQQQQQQQVAVTVEDSDVGDSAPRSNHVHRSMSLQQHRRPDRNNNRNTGSSSSSMLANSNYYSCSNFQLAHLLARAASYDAKWCRELAEETTGDDDWSRQNSLLSLGISESYTSPNSPVSPVSLPVGHTSSQTAHDGLVQLPRRYQLMTSCRGIPASPVQHQVELTPSRDQHITPGTPDRQQRDDSSGYVSGDTDDVTDGESRDELPSDVDQREKDLTVALQWIKQEIRSLKVSDRAIMRQLFELGTVLRRLNGAALNESISCQTVQQPTDVINDVIAESQLDDVTSTPMSGLSYQSYCDESSDDLPPLESQCRAVSMVTVSKRSPSNSKKTFPALVQRLRERFHRSFDQFVD